MLISKLYMISWRTLCDGSAQSVPSSTMRPSSITAILEAFLTVDSLWAMTRAVLCLISRSIDSCTSFSDSLSSDEVASSRMMIGASLKNALAMAMRCLSPPESDVPCSPMTVSYCFSNALMKSCAFAALAASTISSNVASSRP